MVVPKLAMVASIQTTVTAGILHEWQTRPRKICKLGPHTARLKRPAAISGDSDWSTSDTHAPSLFAANTIAVAVQAVDVASDDSYWPLYISWAIATPTGAIHIRSNRYART